MKKRILAISLVVAMLAIAVIGGSLAYFTDTDAETNTFTAGNVKIDLIESQYHRTNAGVSSADSKTKEVPLHGNVLWAPNVDMAGNPENTPNAASAEVTYEGEYFSDAQIEKDAATYKNGYFAENSKNMVPGSCVRKNPYVKNTGNTPAYVRIRVLLPEQPKFSYTITSTAEIQGEVTTAITSETRNGIKYDVLTTTYLDPLQPGELTFWNPIGSVYINEDVTDMNMGDAADYGVIVEADAIQSQGFKDAAEAFAAFDAQ